jgi:hypothetical protein
MALEVRFFNVASFVHAFWFFHDHSPSSASPAILVIRTLFNHIDHITD